MNINDQYKKEFPYSHKEEKFSWVYKFTTFLEWDKNTVFEYIVYSSNVVLNGTNKELFLKHHPIGSTLEFLRGEKQNLLSLHVIALVECVLSITKMLKNLPTTESNIVFGFLLVGKNLTTKMN